MPRYVIDKNLTERSNYFGLLFVPLLLITAFCFGFVLMQPNSTQQSGKKASTTDSNGVNQTADNQLEVLPQETQTVAPIVDTNPSAQQQNQPLGDNGSSSKVTGSSNSRSLQAAPQNSNSEPTRDKNKTTIEGLTQPVKRILP